LPEEKKALQIAALAHLASKLAVQVHIYPWSSNGLEAADILMKGGVAPQKIVICHSDV
jgi:predicted metal-dependent phosphotriesterase family hydrolase